MIVVDVVFAWLIAVARYDKGSSLSGRGGSDSLVDQVLEALTETLTYEGRILACWVGTIGEEDKDEVILWVYPEARPREALVSVGR